MCVYMLMQRERERESETVLELVAEKGRDGGAVGLVMYEALGYWCIRPCATGVCGLKLLVYRNTDIQDTVKLLVYEALSY